jgi:hypothetical protein
VAAGFYVRAEPAHGFAHAAAMVFGTWLVRWLATPPVKKQASLMPADERLAQLQQAVDAVAVEVERIGESQRYAARMLAESAGKPKPDPVSLRSTTPRTPT